MGESHQETQDPSQEREKSSYIQWSPEENKTLIDLLLDAVASGLRDSNGTFSKFTVERRILPTLNRMHGCNILCFIIKLNLLQIHLIDFNNPFILILNSVCLISKSICLI